MNFTPMDADEEGDGPSKEDDKTNRWQIVPGALLMLNQVYALEPFPSTEVRKQLAVKLRAHPRQVQTWFQNRRARERRLGGVVTKPADRSGGSSAPNSSRSSSGVLHGHGNAAPPPLRSMPETSLRSDHVGAALPTHGLDAPSSCSPSHPVDSLVGADGNLPWGAPSAQFRSARAAGNSANGDARPFGQTAEGRGGYGGGGGGSDGSGAAGGAYASRPAWPPSFEKGGPALGARLGTASAALLGGGGGSNGSSGSSGGGPPPHPPMINGSKLRALVRAAAPFRLVSLTQSWILALGADVADLHSGTLTVDELLGYPAEVASGTPPPEGHAALKQAMATSEPIEIQTLVFSAAAAVPNLRFHLVASPLMAPDGSVQMYSLEATPHAEHTNAAILAALQRATSPPPNDAAAAESPGSASAAASRYGMGGSSHSGRRVLGEPRDLHAEALLNSGGHLPRNFLVQRMLSAAATPPAGAAGSFGFGANSMDLIPQQQQASEIDQSEMQTAFVGDGEDERIRLYGHDGAHHCAGGYGDAEGALAASLGVFGSDGAAVMGSLRGAPMMGSDCYFGSGTGGGSAPGVPGNNGASAAAAAAAGGGCVIRRGTTDSNTDSSHSDSGERSAADTQMALSGSHSRGCSSPTHSRPSPTDSHSPVGHDSHRHQVRRGSRMQTIGYLSDGSGDGQSSESGTELTAVYQHAVYQHASAQPFGSSGRGAGEYTSGSLGGIKSAELVACCTASGGSSSLAASRTSSDRGPSSSRSGAGSHGDPDRDGGESTVSDMELRDETGATLDRDTIMQALFNV